LLNWKFLRGFRDGRSTRRVILYGACQAEFIPGAVYFRLMGSAYSALRLVTAIALGKSVSPTFRTCIRRVTVPPGATRTDGRARKGSADRD